MTFATRLLLRLFPRPFRERFGAEIAEQLERDSSEARARGLPARIWFVFATTLDLGASALAERWSPRWVHVDTVPSGELTMGSMLREWMRDFRLAGRSLARSPAFTAVAVGTLALAIGANAAIYSVVDKVLLDPLPFPDADRLVYIAASAPGSQMPEEFGVSDEFYVHYKERSRLLENVSVVNSFTSTLRTDDRVERIRMSWPTNTLYSTLGVRPVLGRLPVDEDENNSAVISHELWATWFGSDSAVIGRSYYIAGQQRQVIGVMGPEFHFPDDGTLLWVSDEVQPGDVEVGDFGAGLVGRMVPGATVDGVARELTALSKELPERFGGSANYTRLIEQHRAIVRPLKTEVLGAVARPLWVLLAAAGIVLVIACANVANLFTVRTEARSRELAVRRAIGAGRAQLIRLQMSEALLIAGAAGVVALFLAFIGLPAFVRAAPQGIPRLGDVRLDQATVLFTFFAAVVAALACGLLPAIRASSPDLTRLREGGRGATRGRHWARNGLVVAQTALALVLLIGSGLLLRSFDKLSRVDPGYDTTDIFTFQIAPDAEHLTDGPSWGRFSMNFMDRLRALPGVQMVGLVENLPLNEGTDDDPFRTEEMSDDPNANTRLKINFAAGDYFRTMGIAVTAGEAFPSRNLAMTQGKVVISQSAANLLWPGRNAVGRRIQRGEEKDWHTVIGVVEDVMQDGFRDTPTPLVYFPLIGPTPESWAVGSPAYVLKTTRADVIAPEVRALVKQVAPNAPMYRVFTMAGLARDSMVQLSFTMLTLGIVSMLALILGAVGLYGVLSYAVAERTREIGVRMALGAEARQVRRMVVVQGARVVGLGVVIGLAVALASTRALGSLLFGVAPADLATFVGMSVSMIAVGVLAAYVPARRASSVDPMESMRGE